MSEFKGVKWTLGGISGRMIKTNKYGGFVADVDTKANALLISKAPEMLEMLQRIMKTYDKGTQTYLDCQELIKQATEI